MEILREVLLTLHLIGMAIIVGGYFTVIRSPRVLPGMLHASYLQLVTGLLLVGLAEMGGGQVDHMKIGIKLVVAILVTVFAFLGNRQEKRFAAETAVESAAAGTTASANGTVTAVRHPSATMAHLTFAFAILNVLVAVFVG
ncbi:MULTISPECIES: hypothetical protein [Brevibacterium]|uniref:Integral membrane protein n=1 Tax=Brevibacterium casei TaxID=33889 RepID=A0AB34XQU6_9MICO|nr:hypothetical protein [Brevibacterium casei]KZE18400.1 hypothetical protein AVW13_12580 [Brevibacterium casei]MCT1448509.1 hypothetical protein [Brevibacterium casei]NJE66218.1 hypothetical protein [Brevibacterium sp. LS14]